VAKAAKGRATNPEAHRLYLLARHLTDRFTREDLARAIEYLKQALALDPDFALAWAELGRAHIREVSNGWSPLAEGVRLAREAAERALSLEPDLAEGYAALVFIQLNNDWDWRGAEASLRRAMELAPGNAWVLGNAGLMAEAIGHTEDALVLLRRSTNQDPLSTSNYFNLGRLLHAMDRQVEAEAAYRKALELSPQMAVTRANLSLVLLAQGRGEEALAEARRESDEAFRLLTLAIVHHVLGRGAESDEALREVIEKYAGDCASQISDVYGVRGEADAAFEWFERAYAQRDGGLVMLKTNPRLRSLHGDPRWGVFLKKMGLED
jgi:serine/threonine-protein kinase